MFNLCRTLVGALLVVAVLPALADDTVRYTIEKSEDGFIRMDRLTGDISLCRTSEGHITCRLAYEDSAALNDRISFLQSRIEALEERLVVLEGSASNGSPRKLPSSEEFEQSLGFMESFFRRFMDIIRDLDSDSKPDGSSGIQPDHT